MLSELPPTTEPSGSSQVNGCAVPWLTGSLMRSDPPPRAPRPRGPRRSGRARSRFESASSLHLLQVRVALLRRRGSLARRGGEDRARSVLTYSLPLRDLRLSGLEAHALLGLRHHFPLSTAKGPEGPFRRISLHNGGAEAPTREELAQLTPGEFSRV